ncbi:MAG: rhomboid family intramembrane serine protease [Phycisphaerales bacterium]|nr:rhomboid family intramembrane serine protease [Phycisphaerales bacterium]
MLIPIGTDRPLRRPTLINFVLVALNIGVFLASAALEKPAPEAREWLYSHGWLDPRGLHWWSFVTYSFLHTGAMHLLANMLVLWVFGGNVEDRLGRVGYTALYLSGAVVAGGAHVLFDTHPVIGASGAVAAVTGAYLVLFPRTVVRCLLLFFMVGIITLPAWAFIMLAIAKDFVYLANSSQAMIDGARGRRCLERAPTWVGTRSGESLASRSFGRGCCRASRSISSPSPARPSGVGPLRRPR